MARKKKSPPQTEKKKQEEVKNTLLSQVLGLVEHFISYFELLFLYFQKTIQKKVQNGFIITIAIFYVFFLKIAGTVLIILSGYFALLNFFNGDHILTSLSLGIGITLFSFIILATLIKKIV